MSQPNGDGDGGTGPLPPPPGTIPLFLQMKSMDKYGMKTGENIEDVVPYMFFNRDEILDEIAKMGFMCDFDPCKDKIAAYPEEEFLVMGDPEQKYGDSWLLCYTIEAKDAIFAAEKAAQEAREAEERRIAEEEARKKAEIEAKLNAVYEDKPIDASPWCSESKEETFNDIQCTSVNANRPPIGLTICRPRGSFLKPLKMADRDVGMDGVLEFRSHKDIAYDVVNVEGEIGLQVTPSTVDLATQTAWFKPVNKALQSETASAINIAKEIQTGIDKGSTKVLTVGGGKSLSRMGSNYRRGMNKGNDLDEQTLDELVDFLIKVRPLMEEALHENETVDIFSNAFTFGGDDESTLGKKGEDELKEIRAFSSLELSKNKPLSAIDWHPKRKGLIAVSPTFKLTFTERVSIDCNVYSSYILIWDFIDFSSPQFVLKSPQDIFTFRFNPSTPQIVVGGTITGQILLWDISSAIDATVSKRNKGVKGKEEEQKIPPIVPKFSSSIDVSHRKTVAELSWLPPSTQINSRGQLLSSEHLTGSTNQFVTIAGDGQVLIWDIRFEEIAEGNLPHVHKPKVQQLYDKKGEKISIPWTPLFRLQLKQPERVGDIPLCKLALSYPGEENISTPNKVDEANQSKILLGTEEGELLQIDWRAIANFVDSSGEDGKDSGASEVTAIEWIEADHTRPCKGVQKSPFFQRFICHNGGLVVSHMESRFSKTCLYVSRFFVLLVLCSMVNIETCRSFNWKS